MFQGEVAWIAVDWGTSNIRAYIMSANSEVLAQVNSTKGMGSLNSDQFELALIELISDYLCDDFITPVIACGMVGAKQGWKEAGYISVPAEPPKSTKFTQPNVNDPRIAVYILPGMSQSMPADVMRGEETQISGYLAQNPNFNGSICLPGTHTKWVQISAGEVVSFRTFMTGELFNIISRHSVLRHSVGEGWDEEAFLESVTDGIMYANILTNMLFGLRASSLLEGLHPTTATAKLSGMLIGLELSGAKGYWLGNQVVIIGGNKIIDHYQAALTQQGVIPICANADEMVLVGLAASYFELKKV
ncbi:2-dehydro-3-deoxygalactonokinase [Amylibacter sp.]|nr:2-dehydro-3-deoxygalactonokinase [Amylibacter sp.]MDB2537653.1 2-dehydro-3-deoxygalactonokinase [Amylibacter sp.]